MRAIFRQVFVFTCIFSQPLFADQVTDFMLDNGMQIVVIEDHRAPVVTHMVWYKTGRADEVAGQSGIAHFFEHLMFKGTDTMKPGAFSEIIAANGGSENAFTSNDFTAYFQRIAADKLDLMMQLEADRMVHLNLSEENVATEKQVILEERNQRVDSDPSALMSEQVAAAQFLNHPYGIPVIGWRHEIEQLSREQALAFYSAYYAPNNAILVVAGDVKPAEVKALAEKHYGVLKPSDKIKSRLRPSEPPQLAERRLTMADPRVAQPFIRRNYLAPERNIGDQKQAAALTILAEVLGGSGTTSVLTRALSFESNTAVYASAYYDGTSVDPDTFNLTVVPAEGVTLQQAEDAMDAVLTKFLATGVDPADLERIKTQVRAAEIYKQDDARAVADEYGAALAVGLTLQDVRDWPNVLQSVTAADVLEAAKSVFQRNNAVTGWLEVGE